MEGLVEQLEILVDRESLGGLLHALAHVCADKAERSVAACDTVAWLEDEKALNAAIQKITH